MRVRMYTIDTEILIFDEDGTGEEQFFSDMGQVGADRDRNDYDGSVVELPLQVFSGVGADPNRRCRDL